MSAQYRPVLSIFGMLLVIIGRLARCEVASYTRRQLPECTRMNLLVLQSSAWHDLADSAGRQEQHEWPVTQDGCLVKCHYKAKHAI